MIYWFCSLVWVGLVWCVVFNWWQRNTFFYDLNCWLGAAGIEILFGRIFKANIQIEGFYSLLRSEEGLKLNTEVSSNIQIEGFYSLLRSEEGLKLNTEVCSKGLASRSAQIWEKSPLYMQL